MKTLIITGGSLDLNFAKKVIDEHDFNKIISVDKGVEYAYHLKLKPDLILGDFDSADLSYLNSYEKMKVKIKRFQAEKDKTDTHIAMEEAILQGSEEIIVLGAIGSRMDHTLANVHILMIPLNHDIQCTLMNKHNSINLTKDTIKVKKDGYDYISLLPLSNKVTGLNTKGLKYELENHTLHQDISLGISNEFLNDSATISIKEGILIVIRSKD